MGEAASAAEPVVPKGEFARICNVTPGRVSQWISEGKISGAALVGAGRSAKIAVAVAQQQLRRHIDVGQRLGNGLQTRLEMPAGDAAPAARSPAADPIDDALRNERLRDMQFKNRESAEKELARRGIYTRTDDVRAAMGGLAAGMLNVFEGSLTDLANAIASAHQLPQRDVLHLLRTEFRTIRARAAQVARQRGEGLAPVIADEVADAVDAGEQGD